VGHDDGGVCDIQLKFGYICDAEDALSFREALWARQLRASVDYGYIPAEQRSHGDDWLGIVTCAEDKQPLRRR
jgi:hypothetical protein